MRYLAAAALVVLCLVGCSGATPVETAPGSPATPAVTPAPPTAAPSPAATATPAAMRSPAVPATAFDGLWLSEHYDMDDLRATLTRAGLDADRFTEVVGSDAGFTDHVAFAVLIKDGKWIEYEIDDDVGGGVAWSGTYDVIDEDTIRATDDASAACQPLYDLSLAGERLKIDIVEDPCDNDDDILFQTAIYESGPFHLATGADAPAPSSSPRPSPLPVSTHAASTSAGRVVTHEKGSVEGANLGYLEYLPPDYADSSLSPLIVFLHGSGQSGDGTRVQIGRVNFEGIPKLISEGNWPDDRPFVVLSPQHLENPPDWCFTSDEIDQFLRFAIEHYDVDPARVYLTGLSCGAIGMWSYLGDHSNELVAAAVPIAGFGIGAIDQQGCALGQLPIWAFHGNFDTNVDVNGDVYPINFLKACTDPPAVDARLTIYPGAGHDVWSRTYDGSGDYDIYSWMRSHTK
jgi:poly(3-hydroxybutyrate) depolymerase